MRYRPTVPLWEHQKQGLKRLWQLGSALVWWDVGTGKTRLAVSYAVARWKAGQVKRVLVVCPLAAVGVWDQEFRAQVTDGLAIATRNDRPDLASFIQAVRDGPMRANGGLGVAVATYETLIRYGAFFADSYRPDLLIVDESQRIKSYSAKRTKRVLAIARKAPYRLCLSGTPAPNGYIDLYWQIKVVQPGALPPSVREFRDRYCVMGGYFDKEIVGYKNTQELASRVAAVTLRADKSKLKLPDTLDQVIPVRLQPTTMRLYDELRRDFVTQVQGVQVLAPNQLVLLTRLMQMTGGFVAEELRDPTKIEALCDLIEAEGKEKVVVFAHYVHEIQAIRRALAKQGYTVAAIWGAVSGPERDQIIRRFQETDDPQILVVQTHAGGVAITLHRAATAIFYSLDYNAEAYEQARGRIHRGGQTRTCRYLHLLAQGTIDEVIYAALRRKMGRQAALAEVVRGLQRGGV